MAMPQGFCRLSLPAASIAGSYMLSLYQSRIWRSVFAPSSFPPLNSPSCSVLPPPPPPALPSFPKSVPSFPKSVLTSEFRMSTRGALGSSSFSSSASAVSKTPEDVLEFWFKDVGPASGVYYRKEWFAGGPEFDAECEKNFGGCFELFSSGALNGWMTTVRGRLALVILLDQISRNVYRNSPSSFAYDQSCIKITLDTIEKGWAKELTPSERRFLYMPLMHSENLRDHEIADRLFEDLANENSENEKLHAELFNGLEFERKHIAVLKRFGRYPTRNAVLGRPNTKEEEEFLSSGGGW